MGKTKLLYEYRNNYRHKNFESKLLLVSDIQSDAPSNKRVFDDHFNITRSEGADVTSKEVRKAEAQVIFRHLDTLVNSKLKWERNVPFRVLLFDEAQLLLKEEFGMKAFQFRCVRLWLRKMQKHKYVAVFTGTSSGLTNFEIEKDHLFLPAVKSRGMDDGMTLRPKGSALFPHFVMLTTIGCQIQLREVTTGPHSTEYHDAIIHGRPLFSIMNDHGDLEAKLPNILRRMLLFRGGEKENVNWGMNLNSWFSILATRVQMGITTIAVASDLVAKGYANLTHIGGSLEISRGKSPSDWVGKLGQIYSSGLCQPEKGDFGEVLAAFYFLLCGDILRHGYDDDLKTFSVDLDLCFALLTNGGNTYATKTPAAKQPRMDKEGKHSSKTPITLSCIQFCRNYLRSYETDWSSLGDQQFLRQLYTSGIGFFTFAGCRTIDAVLPLRIGKGKSEKYIPCLLSIKSRIYFSTGEAQTLCAEMESKANISKLQALCIVVVFGSSFEPKRDEPIFNSDTYSLLENKETVAVVLRIPVEDKFGISRMYQQLTRNNDLMEVYGSHSFIRAHTGKPIPPALHPTAALRVSSLSPDTTPAESLLDTLSEQLVQSPSSQ
ncbi:hypothetical protein IV203_025582 [Nitzschia inconspicua]|uniref:Uncharacterized protein n=1 Tax=Nitzschia inconspicua TaxID=303405 RepID=A0A9K3PWF4_9STRA|nr:hypothetical protein IV203_025582 [Nitzschia inconspicua]